MIPRPTTWPERLAAAERAYADCHVCPRDCGVDRRHAAPPVGAFCRLGRGALVYKELLSLGEERPLGPTWLIDLAGCSLRCPFCSEWAHVVAPQRGAAVALSPGWFQARLQARRAEGAATVSFVGGEPTVNLLAVLEALAPHPAPGAAQARTALPVVWNTNGLLGETAFELLAGVVSTWVIDLKVGPGAHGRLLGAGAMAPFDDVAATIARLLGWPDAAFGPERADGVAMPRLIVRHLLMPGQGDAHTKPVLTWLARHAPEATVNLMTRYLPMGPAAKGQVAPWMARMSGKAARHEAIALAKRLIAPDRLLIDGTPQAAT